MKKFTKFLAALLCLCLLFTSCAPAKQEEAEVSGDSQQVQNLEKLCLVWGYTKYHHPAFLLGQRDWDEELLNLIPTVSEAKEEKVNDILHEWFVSLGEIDYGTDRKRNLPSEDELIVQSDTDWISQEYLGKELCEDLSQMTEVPSINRSKAPVSFQESGKPEFINELLYQDMDYTDLSYRLLGLFRFWNAIEYYSPYLKVMEEEWATLLPQSIQKMQQVEDQTGYELTLFWLASRMNDCHTMLLNGETTVLTLAKDSTQLQLLCGYFGKNFAPVKLVTVDHQPVVAAVGAENCPLMIGDVVLKLDGEDIDKVIEQRKEYIPIPNDEKLSTLYPYLLTSKEETMEVTVLRDGKEETFSVAASPENYACCYLPLAYQQDEGIPYQITEDNIGVLHLQNPLETSVGEMMEQLKDTDGLVIDLRQGIQPSFEISNFHRYFCSDYQGAAQVIVPSQAIPGTYQSSLASAGGTQEEREMLGIYLYQKPVVLLVDENVVSSGEYAAMLMAAGENVALLGENTRGADGNVAYLPLPGNLQITFSSMGIFGPNMEQTQRIGLAPDIEVHPTVEGIKEGRDEVKEAAVAYLQEQNLSSDAAPVQNNSEAPLGSPENPIAEEPQDNGEAPLGSPENPIAEEPQDNSEAPLGSPENPIAEEPQDNSEAPLGSPENPIAEEPQAE